MKKTYIHIQSYNHIHINGQRGAWATATDLTLDPFGCT